MWDFIREMFTFLFAGGIYNEVKTILLINPQTEYELAWKLVTFGYERIVVPLAVGLLFIYFLVYFINKASTEQANFEQLFMLFVKLIAGIFLINNGLEIMAKLYSLGLSMINSLETLATSIGLTTKSPGLADDTLNSLWETLTGCKTIDKNPKGMFDWFGPFFSLVIPYFFQWIATLFIKAICYARLIELLLRFMIAPIAFSDFFMEGLHGAGWKFLKNFAAVSLQGFTICAITLILSAISSGLHAGATNGDFFNIVVIEVVITFAAAGAIMQSNQLIKEVFGSA